MGGGEIIWRQSDDIGRRILKLKDEDVSFSKLECARVIELRNLDREINHVLFWDMERG